MTMQSFHYQQIDKKLYSAKEYNNNMVYTLISQITV